jgi:hypothetical protein
VPLASARHDFKASHDLIPIVRMDETLQSAAACSAVIPR